MEDTEMEDSGKKFAKSLIDRAAGAVQSGGAVAPGEGAGRDACAAEPVDAKGLTEAEFLAAYDADKYPKPSLTADILIFRETPGEDDPELLLIRRKGHPCINQLALPGGFAERGETIEMTAARELEEETGITGMSMELVGVYSKPGRDPRGWTVSAAYMARVAAGQVKPVAGDDAKAVCWARVTSGAGAQGPDSASGSDSAPGSANAQDLGGTFVPRVLLDGKCVNDELAFDHLDIITDAAKRYWGLNG